MIAFLILPIIIIISLHVQAQLLQKIAITLEFETSQALFRCIWTSLQQETRYAFVFHSLEQFQILHKLITLIGINSLIHL